jgi:hypothetical protein
MALEFELMAYTWHHSTNTFFVTVFFFPDRASWTICGSRLWTAVLLMFVSWVARIRGVSHHHQAISPTPYCWFLLLLLFRL